MRAAGPLIHLGTKFGSIDEFVQRFAPFVTETTLIMPAVNDVKVGTDGHFVVNLKDGVEVMSGHCFVEEVRPISSGTAAGRMVMRVRLLDMNDASRAIHQRLLASKKPPAPPIPKPPPLRIVRAPTLIGAAAPPPIGTAPTLIGTVPPLFANAPAPSAQPAEMASPAPVADGVVEATEKNLIPVEKRIPGASFTLPANPLSDLDAGDLASFIECTLFEASGDAAPAKSEAKLPTVPETQAPAAAPEPSMAPTPLPVMPPAPATLKSRLMHAAPYALCTIVGVLVGAAIRGPAHAPPPPPVVAPPAPKPAVAAPAATLPAPAPAVAPPAPTPAPRPTAAPVAPAPAPKPHAAVSGPADCVTNVMTTPDGATVTWGTRPLGVTPVRNAHVPCGESLVALSHERYREVTLNVTTERGQVAVVSERLQRPMGTLTLSSSPGRATFTMNGQVVGAGPRNIKVMRFEHIRVVAKLDGYQPWVKTVYLKEPELKVVAQLVPFPKSFHHWR